MNQSQFDIAWHTAGVVQDPPLTAIDAAIWQRFIPPEVSAMLTISDARDADTMRRLAIRQWRRLNP